MKNLIKKLAPVFLAGALISGCTTVTSNFTIEETTTPNSFSELKPRVKGIILGNGYFAESYRVFDDLDLITSYTVGEKFLQKTDKGYVGESTGNYLQSADVWNDFYDDICLFADTNGDNIITEKEIQTFLDLTYEHMKDSLGWVVDN